MHLIVGAGITGITLAERFAARGEHVTIIDKRDHIGGNCYDYFADGGILVQKYGPHIFHESKPEIIDYLSRFTRWRPYRHRVVARYNDEYYPIPINKTTISKFFGIELDGETSVRNFLDKRRVVTPEIRNSRDVVVSRFGEELYEAFIHHYTKKQWDLYPEELDRAILERLPVRYDDNPFYFSDTFEGLPINGYTRLFENMLDHPNIRLCLATDFAEVAELDSYDWIIYTGRIDQYYGYDLGALQYRCIDFQFETLDMEQYQPYPVINYPQPDHAFTRCTEFNHFTGMTAKKTIILKEYPAWEGEPSYPVINPGNVSLFERYVERAREEKRVRFAGRSGTFRYLDMNVAVAEAFKLFEALQHDR
jgi:UDP-galactopyranose mutase